jgi:3-hydroxybutyrate dehydrogenase
MRLEIVWREGWAHITGTGPDGARIRRSLKTRDPRRAEEARAALEGLSPQNRLYRPDEVTAAALYLCGAGSDGINGQAITIAGGEV